MVKDMTVGKPAGVILQFAVPVMLGNLLQQLYNIVDAAIVGKYLGIEALAGVGASTSVMFLILGFCNGCAGGFGVPIAQCFGAKEYSSMRRCVANTLFISAIMAVVFTAVTALLCRDILVAMKTPDDIIDGAYDYLLITFLGIPFTFGYNILASIIRALGDSKTPFMFLIVASILNIVLDFAFILGLNLGTAGAALATLLSQAVAAVACVVYMRRHFPILRMTDEERRIDGRYIKTLLNMGVPMGLQFSITAIGSIMLQSANNALGTACIAAFTAANRLKMFFICPFETLGIAMATYCGQNYGACQVQRIKDGIVAALKMMAVYAVFTFVTLHLFSRTLALLFVAPSQTEIIDKTYQFLATSSSLHLLLGVLCVFRYSIQGLGYSKMAIMSGVCEMVTRVCLSLWVIPAVGFTAVCFGDPAAWLSGDLFLVPAYIWLIGHITRKLARNGFSLHNDGAQPLEQHPQEPEARQ